MSEFLAQSCVNLEILSLSACPGIKRKLRLVTLTYSRYLPTP